MRGKLPRNEGKGVIMKDEDGIYIDCACLEELVKLTLLLDHVPRGEVCIAYFNQPGRYNSWRWKIRNIWRILRYGDCTQDWIAIEDPKELRRLANWLLRAAREIEARKVMMKIEIQKQKKEYAAKGSNHDR